MKRLLIVFLILAPLSDVSGQEAKRFRIGDIMVYGGAAWSRYPKESELWGGAPYYYSEPRNRAGAAAGLGCLIPLSKVLSIDVRLHYIRKGIVMNWYEVDMFTGDFIPIVKWTYSLDTLGNSTTFRFKPFPKSFPYILAGYDLAWILDHHVTYDIGGSDPFSASLKSQTRKVDLGLVAGAGVEFTSQKLAPFVEVRYCLGLLDLNKTLDFFHSLRTQALILLGGIKIRLGKN